MPLSLKEIAVAEKMHEFVRAHERNHRQTIWVNCITIPLVLATSFQQIVAGHTALGYSMVGIAIGFAFTLSLIIPAQRKRYKEASVLLQILEREHSDQLSWVEVEKHLTEMKELEQELANRHATP
jgi:hypothetical protein